MELREYQQRTVDMVRDKIRQGHKRIIIAQPTGSGKTHILANIFAGALDKGNRAIAVVHRRQLVEQMADRFGECGIKTGIIMAGEDTDLSCPAQVMTMQTYDRRLQLDDPIYNPYFIDADVVLIDEAHHALSKTYQNILSYYENKVIIGVTATPVLAKGVGMGNYFDAIVQPVGVQELIDLGHLVPGRYYGPGELDLSGVKIQAGDYQQKDLDRVVNVPKIIGDVVDNWLRIAGGLRTMVFAVNVKHSKALRDEFLRRDVKAEHLDAYSEDDERNETLNRFRSGETQVLTNVALFTEGTDIPEIECIDLARPTKSFGLYLQMVGRGARPCNGKSEFIVIDHGACIQKEGFGFYEDPIEWSLDGKKPAYRRKHEKHKEKKIMCCERCNCEFYGNVCTTCGFEVKHYNKKIEAIEAQLEEISKDKKRMTRAEKEMWYRMLLSEQKRLGKNDKWLLAQYKSKTGVWPRDMEYASPVPASQEVLNWLKYKKIKWAKRKRKEEDERKTAYMTARGGELAARYAG